MFHKNSSSTGFGKLHMAEGTINIRKIAEAAGVSIASVSRALQDPPSPKISAKQRKHVLDICAQMQYYPNAHTQRMFAGRADTVAILFPPYATISSDAAALAVDMNFSACMMGAQSVLAARGIGLLLNELTTDYLQERRYLRMIRGKAVDGVLIWGALSGDGWLTELLDEGIPAVMLQTAVAGCDCPVVIADDRRGMTELMEKVLAAGHSRIALIPASEQASTGRERNAAVRNTLAAHGMRLVAEFPDSGYGYCFGRRAAAGILAATPDVDCIVSSNDMAAWGCIDELRSHGIAVPGKISVVGADGLRLPGDTQVSSYFSPSLEIGRTGAKLLLELLDGEIPARTTVLPVTPVAGNTIRNG